MKSVTQPQNQESQDVSDFPIKHNDVIVALYTGTLKGGKRDGKGIEVFITSKPHAKYNGEFKDDKRCGKGSATLSSTELIIGEFYDNQFINKDDKGIACGIIQFKPESLTIEYRYEGALINNILPHGFGCKKYSNGVIEQGEFDKGLMHGHIRVIRPLDTEDVLYFDSTANNGVLSNICIKYYVGGEKYIGQVKDGQRHGIGKIVYKKGVYIGQLSNNQRHGLGKLVFEDGKIYEGQWNCNKREGQGRITDQRKIRVLQEGNWVDFQLKESCKIDTTIIDQLKIMVNQQFPTIEQELLEISKVNDKMFGPFQPQCCKVSQKPYMYEQKIYCYYTGDLDSQGLRTGRGTQNYISGASFEGIFSNNIMTVGRLKTSDGQVFEGECINNNFILKDNSGKIRKIFYLNQIDLTVNSIYEGDLVDDKRDGIGKHQMLTGESFQGRFKSDKLNGPARVEIPDKYVSDFEYVDDTRDGCGRILFSDGNIYIGQQVNNLNHGVGKLRMEAGTYIGTWEDGQQKLGQLRTKSTFYTGEWQNSRAHGYGRRIEKNVVEEGIFDNGKFIKGWKLSSEFTNELKDIVQRRFPAVEVKVSKIIAQNDISFEPYIASNEVYRSQIATLDRSGLSNSNGFNQSYIQLIDQENQLVEFDKPLYKVVQQKDLICLIIDKSNDPIDISSIFKEHRKKLFHVMTSLSALKPLDQPLRFEALKYITLCDFVQDTMFDFSHFKKLRHFVCSSIIGNGSFALSGGYLNLLDISSCSIKINVSDITIDNLICKMLDLSIFSGDELTVVSAFTQSECLGQLSSEMRHYLAEKY